jgi:hypothetical protein
MDKGGNQSRRDHHLLQGQGCPGEFEQGRDRSARLCETHTVGQQRPGETSGRTGRDIRARWTKGAIKRDGTTCCRVRVRDARESLNRAGIDLHDSAKHTCCRSAETGRDNRARQHGYRQRGGNQSRWTTCCRVRDARESLNRAGGRAASWYTVPEVCTSLRDTHCRSAETGRDIRARQQGYGQRGNRDGPPAAGSGMPGEW